MAKLLIAFLTDSAIISIKEYDLKYQNTKNTNSKINIESLIMALC